MSGQNPEASRVVRVYRRMLPEDARSAVANALPVGVRRRVKEAAANAQAPVTQSLHRVRAKVVLRRWSGGHLPQGQQAAVVGGLVALVQSRPTPVDLREHVLGLVTGALADAGVRHFALRGRSDLRSVLAVPAGERAAAFAALRALGRQVPCYVSQSDREGRPVGGFRDMGVPGTWHRLDRADAVRVAQLWTEPSCRLLLGATYGCEIEFWPEEEGHLVAPRPNHFTLAVPLEGPDTEAPVSALSQFSRPSGATEATVPTRRDFTIRRPDDIDFPIDVVYTWVDGGDPEWQARRAEADGSALEDAAYHEQSSNAARYLSRQELRYSLRSLAMYAPWVRRVYVVTDGQRPEWLRTDHPGLHLVTHQEIFADRGLLPTFNSHAIESQLHHIDGLAEHFLYFNDDMFLGRPLLPQQFFLANGTTRFFPSNALIPAARRGPDDLPVDAASKNNRDLIRDRFGSVITQKMLHVPYPLRRSVLDEIEREFKEQHLATAGSRFRSMTDISIPSSLHHYYAYHTSRALPSELAYRYVDLGLPNVGRYLGLLLAKRDRDAFCLNDTVTDPAASASVDALVRNFLNTYFPVPSPFEQTGQA